jgi:hypothetical protein
VTAGTVFEGTRTPLRQWFRAAWLLAAAEQGVSARRLQRDLGLGSYETAWTMLHRYRRAMVRSGRPRLSGPVELAAAELAARPATAAVGVAVEDRGAEPGRVRMQRLEGPTPPALAAFAARAVEPGAVRARDAATVAALAAAGYASRLAAALPHLDAVVVALGRWLRGTHQAAAAAHLDQYLDEFTFRFNRRSSTHPGLRFYRLLEEAVVTPPTPYRSLVAPRPSPNRRPPA